MTAEEKVNLIEPEDTALKICAGPGTSKMVVTIHYDGTVEFGPGYGANTETAREFWRLVGEAFPGIIPRNPI